MNHVAGAFRMLTSHFGIFAIIVFIFWIPGNFLLNWYLFYHVDAEDFGSSMRVGSYINAIIGPPVIAAVIFAAAKIRIGQEVTVGEAIRHGLSCWVRVFGLRFIVNLLVFLGLILLIIPGIIFALRFSLAIFAVTLEDIGIGTAMNRSSQLTKGRFLEIFSGPC